MKTAGASFQITTPNTEEFTWIQQSVKELELDDRNMAAEQFLIAKKGTELLGYIRIRHYEGFSELSTLGVPAPHRLKGIAASLVNSFVERSSSRLYLVCIIPDFFSKLGFEICSDYPTELQQKLNYCRGSLPVEETYVVMCCNRFTNPAIKA